MKYSITEKEVNFSVYAISSYKKNILLGGSNKKLLVYQNDFFSELVEHKKSIKCIYSYKDLFGCGSYDCSASIFKEGVFWDEILGLESEIKGISINDEYIALATRAKSVWIVKYNKEIEIDSVLEDHTQDIKGCIFYNNRLFSYSYDGTIKIYLKNNQLDTWDLIQNIYEGNTVWCISFLNDQLITANDDGYIRIYTMYEEYYLTKEIPASIYPIQSLIIVNGLICFVLNRDHLCFIDLDGNIQFSIEGLKEINCLYFLEEENVLVVGQNGCVKFIKFIKNE